MKNQRGFTLIELVISIVIFSLTAYVLASMMLNRSKYAESVSVGKSASDAAENALKKFSAAAFDELAVGGSLTVLGEDVIASGSCSPQTCDYVVEADTPGAVTLPAAASPAGGIVWQANYTPPAGTRIAYVRRWSIEEFNTDLHLRRITVAVMADSAESHPLVMIKTIVGDK